MSRYFQKRFVGFFRRILLITSFLIFYVRELFVSSIMLARDIFRRRQAYNHGIVKIEIELKSDLALLAFINLLSMTPGSLSLDLSPDKRFIYVHTMYLEDVDRFKRDLKIKFEQRIKAIFE